MPPAWKLRTYDTDLTDNLVSVESRLVMDDRPSRSEPKFRCPICGTPRLAFLLVEVSALPHALTGGASYACDGCWTRWEREERSIPHPRTPTRGVPFDEAVMYEYFNAPEEMLVKVRAALDRTRALKRITPSATA